MKYNSIRITPPNWRSNAQFQTLLHLLDRYPCGIRDLVFFTSFTHAPLTLDEIRNRLTIIRQRMAEARRNGYRAGINILATIGHHNEDLDRSLQGTYTHMTGADGSICRGSYCMNDPRYLEEYVVPVYQMLADSGPDFIWIDDDVRYGHMPVGKCCYCDRCIAIFNEENGTDFTRQELVDALNSGDVALRKKFLKKNSDAIANLMQIIAKTVRSVSSTVALGFMTGDRFYDGNEFLRYYDILSENGMYQVMARPGGGAYQDRSFEDILEKADEIGFQCALLPPYISAIQSEIENFPYDVIQKTPHSNAQEVLLYIAAGCTGAAFNILPGASELPGENDEPLESIEPLLKKLNATYAFEELLSQTIRSRKSLGIHTGWRYNSQAAVPEGSFIPASAGSEFCLYATEVLEQGLPVTYRPDNASITFLREKAAAVMTDDELLDIFRGGVYLDASALDYVNSRGFGAYTGFSVKQAHPVDAHEFYLPHPINAGIAGGKRNCRQAFYPGPSFELVPTAAGAQPLAALTDYQDQFLAPCTMGIFENTLGGRVCAAGYYPFNRVSFYQKSLQLKRVMRYLSGGRCPMVTTHARTRLWAFEGCLVLFNVTNDTAENLELDLGTRASGALRYDCSNITPVSLPMHESEGNTFVTVDRLAPFEMCLITFH